MGRDFSGVDCWGLRYLIFRHELGVTLPSYAGAYATPEDVQAIRALVAGRERDHEEIPPGSEQPFDAVLMRVARAPVHIATVCGDGLLLHIEAGRVSLVASYAAGSLLSHRVLGFYRYRERP